MKRMIAYLMCLTLVIASKATSQPGMMGRGEMGPRFMRMIEELKLTDDQQKKMQDMRFDIMKQMVSHRSKVATAAIEFRELTAKDNPDKAALEKKINISLICVRKGRR